MAEDQTALAELIYQRLATVPGVLRVVPALAVDVLKNQPDWVPLSTSNKTAHHQATADLGGAKSPAGEAISAAVHSRSSSGGGGAL